MLLQLQKRHYDFDILKSMTLGTSNTFNMVKLKNENESGCQIYLEICITWQNSHELLLFQIFWPRFGLAAMEPKFERDLGWVPNLFLPYFGLAQHFLEIDKIATNSYNFENFDPDLVWQPWKLNLEEI